MKRIEALSKLTKGTNTLLDIGTDHGYLLIDALNNHYIQKGIACDINEQPLKNAYKNIKMAGLESQVSFVLSNGFLNVNEPYDGVVIAGMGMHLVKTILSQKHLTPNKYIVSVHNHLDQFRRFITDNGFKIENEEVIHEKFYYVLFVLTKNEEKLTEKQMFLGPVLQSKIEALSYYEHLLKINEELYQKVPTVRQQSLEVQIKWLKMAIKSLKATKSINKKSRI
ncbi:MAG: class I SAM-dependent methyltransferase [Acholeplasma sp.]|nr:class I SAM-dependent methyltransferase [Acholeplasma sp.]